MKILGDVLAKNGSPQLPNAGHYIRVVPPVERSVVHLHRTARRWLVGPTQEHSIAIMEQPVVRPFRHVDGPSDRALDLLQVRVTGGSTQSPDRRVKHTA